MEECPRFVVFVFTVEYKDNIAGPRTRGCGAELFLVGSGSGKTITEPNSASAVIIGTDTR